jgi:hypothetical protein
MLFLDLPCLGLDLGFSRLFGGQLLPVHSHLGATGNAPIQTKLHNIITNDNGCDA